MQLHISEILESYHGDRCLPRYFGLIATRLMTCALIIKESSRIRDLVFGFGDGVNTSLGIIAGVGGAAVAADIVILAALVGMFTGAKAMAVQMEDCSKSDKDVWLKTMLTEELGLNLEILGSPIKSALIMFGAPTWHYPNCTVLCC